MIRKLFALIVGLVVTGLLVVGTAPAAETMTPAAIAIPAPTPMDSTRARLRPAPVGLVP